MKKKLGFTQRRKERKEIHLSNVLCAIAELSDFT